MRDRPPRRWPRLEVLQCTYARGLRSRSLRARGIANVPGGGTKRSPSVVEGLRVTARGRKLLPNHLDESGLPDARPGVAVRHHPVSACRGRRTPIERRGPSIVPDDHSKIARPIRSAVHRRAYCRRRLWSCAYDVRPGECARGARYPLDVEPRRGADRHGSGTHSQRRVGRNSGRHGGWCGRRRRGGRRRGRRCWRWSRCWSRCCARRRRGRWTGWRRRGAGRRSLSRDRRGARRQGRSRGRRRFGARRFRWLTSRARSERLVSDVDAGRIGRNVVRTTRPDHGNVPGVRLVGVGHH